MAWRGTPSHCSAGAAGKFDFTALLQLLQEFRGAEQRLAGAENVFDQAAAGFRGSGGGLLLVDEVGEAEQLRFGIVNGDGEITSGHEFVDDAVNGGEELLEILSGARLFRRCDRERS